MERTELERVLRATVKREFRERWSSGPDAVSFAFAPLEHAYHVGEPCQVDDDCALYFYCVLPTDWLAYAVGTLWAQLGLASWLAATALQWKGAGDVARSPLTNSDLWQLECWLNGGTEPNGATRSTRSLSLWKLLQEPERWGGEAAAGQSRGESP